MVHVFTLTSVLVFVSEDQLLQLINDLFVGGTDTVTNTLLFSIIFMLLHPDIRVKVQKEIDEQLGRDPPSMADMLRMPLVQATLLEIQRLADVVPLGVSHNDGGRGIHGLPVPQGDYCTGQSLCCEQVQIPGSLWCFSLEILGAKQSWFSRHQRQHTLTWQANFNGV